MDIRKETYVAADEDTTKAMTFDLLTGLHQKIDNLTGCYEEHLKTCNGRFTKLENRKKVDAAISGGAGVVGGFMSGLMGWFK